MFLCFKIVGFKIVGFQLCLGTKKEMEAAYVYVYHRRDKWNAPKT